MIIDGSKAKPPIREGGRINHIINNLSITHIGNPVAISYELNLYGHIAGEHVFIIAKVMFRQ